MLLNARIAQARCNLALEGWRTVTWKNCKFRAELHSRSVTYYFSLGALRSWVGNRRSMEHEGNVSGSMPYQIGFHDYGQSVWKACERLSSSYRSRASLLHAGKKRLGE